MKQIIQAWRIHELLRYYRLHGVMSGAVAGSNGGRHTPLTARWIPYPA